MSTPNRPTWISSNKIEQFNHHIRHERDSARTLLPAAHKTIDYLEEQVIQVNLDLNVDHIAPVPNVPVPVFAATASTNFSTFGSETFPEKFDDIRTKIPGFVTQLRMKLEVNHNHFRNGTAKVIHSVTCLEGRALDQVIQLVNANPADFFSSVTFFVAQMEGSFRELNIQSTNHRQLIPLRQGKGDFATYYSQLIRNVSHLHYNKRVKIDELPERLSDNFRDVMTYRTDRPNMVEAYATMSVMIDNHM
ncbi:uncharacterized protein H6S33_003326 [Morchella sextelata]|uniref:uncharacterized protein n=1 Tax=Morchella sextelata TaxID=1174677 RepID=UPI001D03DF35|nr:uncharacterized protein H6S33_003326 [Morchella sextelata]KAH0606492.1 hypothetical protein H6S33_003326 [Morchella sextelata]